jgi:hypothetical protein
MSLDPSSIEPDLQRLRAAALDDPLLARLEACAANTWTDLNPTEIRFEQRLQISTPAMLPPALMASLEAVVAAVPFPGNEKIVRFPHQTASAVRHHRAWWSAAAAVAISGALTALLLPTHHNTAKLANTPPKSAVTRPAPSTGELIPADFKRGLSEARDEGVIWQSNDQPHRVLKFVYLENATLKDTAGRTYQVEQPRVEYILVPAKTD